MGDLSIDRALAPIASALKWQADDILDLREAAQDGRDAGRCVRCYFKLYGAAQRINEPGVSHLRRWLEDHLEIVARDETQRELERVPVSLEGEDLESYCLEVMNEFHDNRNYQNGQIDLSFCFKESV